MIDTDKYEGHSPQEKWHIDESSVGMGKGFVGSLCLCELCQDEVYLEGSNERELCDEVKANLRLMADAPLLLAEVKRLRGLMDKIVDIAIKELEIFDDNCPMINIRDLAYKGILWEK